MISQNIESHRRKWARLAKKNGWYSKPFFIQIFKNEDGKIVDSVAYKDMTEDVIVTTSAYNN